MYRRHEETANHRVAGRIAPVLHAPVRGRRKRGKLASGSWRGILLILLIASGLGVPPARAAEPAKAQRGDKSNTRAASAARSRIIVDHFQGEQARRVRAELTKVLEAQESLDVVSVRHLDAQRALDATMDGSAEGWAEVSRRLAVTALIRGRVLKEGDRRILSLTVLSGRDGRRLGRVEFEAPSYKELREEVSANAWQQLRPLLEQAAGAQPKTAEPPAEPEPSPYGAEKPSEPPASEPKPKATAEPVREPPSDESVERARAFVAPGRAQRPCSWLEIRASRGCDDAFVFLRRRAERSTSELRPARWTGRRARSHLLSGRAREL